MLYSFFKKKYHNFLKTKRQQYIESLIKNGLKLGKEVEIIDNFFFDPSHCFLISIGDNTTICPNVRLIAHDASTKRITGYTKIGKIHIEENCFIGESAIILLNVTIGANSIIGAGAVVTHDIPPQSIAAGNPAKVISNVYEYEKKIINISKTKKIFDENYLIDKLDDTKRKEILLSIADSIGFIV